MNNPQQRNKSDRTLIMAMSPVQTESTFICTVCFNLDPDRCPDKSLPRLLGEQRVTVPFSDLKRSAEEGNCLACKIINVGLENMEELWEEGAESENQDQILCEETHLLLGLRRGHSLRVTLANVGYETTLEFYTLSSDGMIAFCLDCLC